MINRLIRSDSQRTAELRQYILNKLEKGGITENDIASDIFFNDKLNCMGTFVYCKGRKYCLKYLGFRESECHFSSFDNRDELTSELLKDIIVNKALKECPLRYKEYSLQLASKIDDRTADLLEKEFSLTYFK